MRKLLAVILIVGGLAVLAVCWPRQPPPGFLGVRLEFPDAPPAGALIVDVITGTPAAAGLRAGDLVIEVDGERIERPDKLIRRVTERGAGRSIVLTLLSPAKSPTAAAPDVSTRRVEVVLGERPVLPPPSEE